MKLTTLTAGACLACAAAAAAAQTVIVEPTRTIEDPTVVVGSTTPTPESPAIARKEAAAALAQAQQDCRNQGGRAAQTSCLSAAHEDYARMMKKAKGQASNGSS